MPFNRFLSGDIVLTLDINGKYSDLSDRCMFTYNASYPSVGLWVKAAYDTCICIAISARIISYSYPAADRTANPTLWRSCRGFGLPRACRDLLYDGLLFYLSVNLSSPHHRPKLKRFSVTLGVTVTAACTAMFPVASSYNLVLTEPAVAIESIMACMVFRRVVLASSKSKGGLGSLRAPDDGGIVMTTILQ